MDDMHSRNPVFSWDVGPVTAPQPRLTGTQQTGRLAIIGNPISYVVTPGRYLPFLSLRGHSDPVTRDLTDRLVLGQQVGEDIPDNRVPQFATPGYTRTLGPQSTRGAVQQDARPLANATLTGTGPLGSDRLHNPDHVDFFTGVPASYGEIGI